MRMHVARCAALVLMLGACGKHAAPRGVGDVDQSAPGASDLTVAADADVDVASAPPSDAGVANDASVPAGDAALAVLPPPPATCTPTIALADVATPKTTVSTCTEAALQAALTAGGVIVFDCGGAATIHVTSELVVPSDRDTVLDGGGVITLDGGGTMRLLHYTSGDYRSMYGGQQHVLTVQRLRFTNAAAMGTKMFPPQDPPCSQGYQDGAGGAILMESGTLHVIDCSFQNNVAAPSGPDVGGAAIYSSGSSDTTIVGSSFDGNRASNGAAIGALNSDLTLTNNTLSNNATTGQGGNATNDTCPLVGGQNETGSGGNGGAVSIDGTSAVAICGCTFSHNVGHANGGALFRTPDGTGGVMTIDRSTFDGNSCDGTYDNTATGQGGALAFYGATINVTASTFSNNAAPGGGAIVGAAGDTFSVVNSTFAGNLASTGVGGAIGGLGGTITNCTFANNQAHGTAYAAFAAALFGGPWVVTNTIFDGNTDNDNSGDETCAYFGGTNTGGHNVQWPHGGNDSACEPSIAYTDAMLGALGDNGGTTATIKPGVSLQTGVACPATDQTGKPRATPCTLGALEVP